MFKKILLLLIALFFVIPNLALASIDHFKIEFGKQHAQINEPIDIIITAVDTNNQVVSNYEGATIIFSESDIHAQYSNDLKKTYNFKKSDNGKVTFKNAIKYTKIGIQDIFIYDLNHTDHYGVQEIEILPKDQYLVGNAVNKTLIKDYIEKVNEAYKNIANIKDVKKLYKIEKVVNKILSRYSLGEEINHKEAIIYNLALYIKQKNEKLLTLMYGDKTKKKSIPLYLDHFNVEIVDQQDKIGKTLDLKIAAIDSHGNIMQDYEGEVLIFSEFDKDAKFLAPIDEQIFSFRKDDKGKVYIKDVVSFTKNGLMNVWVYDLIDDNAFGVDEIEISNELFKTL